VPVAFRDADDLADRGFAALLRVLRVDAAGDTAFVGGLLLVNAYAEPVEFVHNRMSVPETSLCPPDRLPSFAAKSLVASLFHGCARAPLFVVLAEDELDDELFLRRLAVAVPVGAVNTGSSSTTGQPEVRWLGQPPGGGSREAALLQMLSERRLLSDALARAGEGLRAVYGGSVNEDVVG
jgi:hypothetical protein